MTPEDSNSLSDLSDNNVDVMPSPKITERKERKKRKSRKRTTTKTPAVKDMLETDKVSFQGFTHFYDKFNIDKICM